MTLPQTQRLQVGGLGHFSFPPGEYAYLGSAHGPGGLRGRLMRHLRGDAPRPHWHIDYLRNLARVKAFCYAVEAHARDLRTPLECLWSQALAEFPEAAIPAPGFGASDCASLCEAHLVHFPFDTRQDSTELSYTRLLEVLRKSCPFELTPRLP